MSEETVISVENLGKKYIIGHNKSQPYNALRDVIADGIKSVGKRFSRQYDKKIISSNREEFWALKDVNF
ncbi:MAG TPA: ABC transporter ATP-binding protein, partial [Phormidium sp.]